MLSTNLSAQDFAIITGTVNDDVLRQPIAGVVVTALPQGNSTLTDGDGQYRLTRITPGDITLIFESAFHLRNQSSSLLAREGETITVDATLKPLTIKAKPQTVSVSCDTDAGATIFDLNEIQGSEKNDVGEFLSEKGYQVQSDGRSHYLSLGGLSPQRTLVLLDGVRLNPDGGAADLSQIPLSSIDRIEVITSGAGAKYGEGALGGAVNIISKRASAGEANNISVSSGIGNYSATRGSLQLSRDLQRVAGVFGNYEYSFARNDYSYTHPYLGEQSRVNNFSRQSNYFATATPDRLRQLALTVRSYRSHQGIPGAVLQETPNANARHSNLQFSANVKSNTITAAASYRELTQQYQNGEGVSIYDRRYLQVARQIDLAREWSVGKRFRLELGGQYLSEHFFNDDRIFPPASLPSVSRKTNAAFGRAAAHRDIGMVQPAFAAAYRIDRIDDHTFTSPHLALSLTTQKLVDAKLAANYAEAHRLPPIDALFWSNDVFAIGNPDLKEERSKIRDLTFAVSEQGMVNASIKVRRFFNDIDGMIFWRQRFDGKYMPVNLARARIDGTEYNLSLASNSQRLLIEYHRTDQNPINRSRSENYFGQTIPFQPNKTQRFTVRLRHWQCQLSYMFSYVGGRFIREANTKSLPSYGLHDVTFETQLDLLDARETLRLTVYNIADKQYEILERVPMPGRSFNLSLTVQL